MEEQRFRSVIVVGEKKVGGYGARKGVERAFEDGRKK